MPEISVIVPVYNVENKIRRCIDSILAQTFTDFELILVDDGSPDRSGDICDEYAETDSRIRVIHQENKGVSAARNKGIVEAKGIYIAFVDSDDYVEDNYLSALYLGIKKSQLSICGVFFCAEGSDNKTAQEPYEDSSLLFSLNNTEKTANLLKCRRFNYVYSKLFLKDIIINNHIYFEETVKLGEDTVFVMEYIKAIDSLYIVGASYYNYIRYQSGTLTTSFSQNSFEQFSYVNDKIEESFRKKGLLDYTILKVIDERRLESSGWAIDSIMMNIGLTKNEKIQLLVPICNSESLLAAIDRNPDTVTSNGLLSKIKRTSAYGVYSYYESQRKKNIINSYFKVFIVKIFPHGFIQKVKKWFRIAQ